MRSRASIAIALLIALPASTYGQTVQAPPPACPDSQAKGRADAASSHHGTGWFFGGLASGLVLGFIGTGAITGIAALRHPQPKQVPSGLQAECYREGYSSKAKKKNTLMAFIGGAIGGVVWTTWYIGSRPGGIYYDRVPLASAAGR
jgi:hypothetical protein